MISFRFHLVSLVAVFLALGLGVLTGTTVINQGIVRGLEGRTESLSRDLEQVRDEVGRLQAEGEAWSAFGDEAMGPLLSGRLADQQVVLVIEEGTDGASVEGVLQALRSAGAEIVGPMAVTGRMALESDSDRLDLATAIGADGTEDAQVLADQAAQLLAERLSLGAAGNSTLEDLIAAGFVVDEGPEIGEAGFRDLGGQGQPVVVLAGGPSLARPQPDGFLVPLVRELADTGASVAAGEPANGAEQAPPFVGLLRSDGQVGARIATQDNVDQEPGQIGLVLALEDLLTGVAGHYGIKDGATRPIPEL